MKRTKYILLFTLVLLMLSAMLPSFLASATTPNDTPSYYLSENSNVDTMHAITLGAMPCIGEAKILVFYVDFEDGLPLWTNTKEEVEDLFFSEEAKNDSSLAYSEKDSLRSYYYRSSYGKVDITGSVFEYQAQEPSIYYRNNDEALYDEIIAHYKNLISWDDFDGNNDGYIDGVYIVAKNAPTGYELWPNSYVTGGSNRTNVDNKTISKFSFIGENRFETILHETCHMFGVPDMYAGIGLNPSGIETKCIMENGQGDLPSPTKFTFGWLDNVTFISSDNIGSFDLRSYSFYGDVLVIYPNGDNTNRNWFFVEYVTNEGNNGGEYPFANTYGEYGVRIWRTQMMLDENYNIIGAGPEFGVGDAPSPYEYLDTIHPWGIINYYMQEGDEITPYTEISTAYSDTHYMVGGSKFLKDLTFSGIHINFEKLQNNKAIIKVDIEEHPNTALKTEAELNIHSSDKSSAYIDNNDSLNFASITSGTELKVNGAIRLISQSANLEYTVETIISYNKKTIKLYIETEKLSTLKKYSDWTLSISDVTTYYGSDITLSGSEQIIKFSNYVSSLIDNDELYPTGFKMESDTVLNYRFRYFKLSDTVVLSIYFDDIANKLYWGEIDTATNTTKITELPVPQALNLDAWMQTLDRKPVEVWKDGEYYFVYIGNYICAYQNKSLISYFDCTSLELPVVYTMIKNNNAFFIDIQTNFYKVALENNAIVLNKVDFGEFPETNHGIEILYPVGKNQYLIVMPTYARFVDLDNNITKDYYFTSDECLYSAPLNTLYCLDGYYYVFFAYEDLTMYKFDKDFNLLNQTVVLKDFSSTIISCYRLEVDFYNNTWVISLDGTSLGYSNSYLFLCSQNGQVLNYYKYGTADKLGECYFIPMSAYKILVIDEYFGEYAIGTKLESTFTYINTVCNSHNLDNWETALAPTCIGEGYYKRNCTKCEYFETQYIPVLGHSYSDWTETIKPKCEADGEERKDCINCNHYETKKILATGHIDTNEDKICDTCGWKEKEEFPTGAVVGIILGSVAALGLIAWFLFKKKSH